MEFHEYQIGTSKTALYPGKYTIQGLVYTTLGLAGEAGEIANKVKKILRDDDGVMSQETRLKIVDEVGDVCWYLSQLCAELGVSLNTVAESNLEKLSRRQAKGTIQGSGDNR